MYLIFIERSSLGLSDTIKIIEIIKELMEIGLNEVCDKVVCSLSTTMFVVL